MRLFVVLFCLSIVINGFAQNHRECPKPRVLLKIAPLASIDYISFPTIQGGVEVALGPRIGWYNEFGYKYTKGMDEKTDTSFVSSSGYKVKSEIRYYFRAKYDDHGNWLRDHYVAINFYYSRNVFNQGIGYYYQNDSSTRLYDDFGVTKSIWGTNVIFGWQTEINKRFLVDVYGGLGTRFRDIVTVNKQFDPEQDERIRSRHPNAFNLKNNAEAKGGKSGTINISFGVRFACRLF